MISIEQASQLPKLLEAIVKPEHIDELGHMNVKFYLGFFEATWWEFGAHLGMDKNYHIDQKMSLMALRHILSYLAEVREGESISVHGRILARKEKRIHFIYYMVNQSRPMVSATLEGLVIHVDLDTRKSVPFPFEVSNQIDKLIAKNHRYNWEPTLSGGIIL